MAQKHTGDIIGGPMVNGQGEERSGRVVDSTAGVRRGLYDTRGNTQLRSTLFI